MRRLVIFLTALMICTCSCKSVDEAEKQSTQSFLEGNWPQTVDRARQWAKQDSENPVPHALLNIAYTELQARDAMKAELEPAYGSSDRVTKVEGWASALVLSNHNNPRAYLLKGLAYEVAGDNQTAIDAYRAAMTVDPSFKQGYESLGNLYLANHMLDEAQAVYSALLERDPNYSAAYDHLATVYVMKGDMQQAVSYFEKAVAHDPNDVTAEYNLASAYLDRGAPEKAVPVLQKVVQLDPTGEVGQDAKQKLAGLSK